MRFSRPLPAQEYIENSNGKLVPKQTDRIPEPVSRQKASPMQPPLDPRRQDSAGTARRGGRSTAGPSSRPSYNGGGAADNTDKATSARVNTNATSAHPVTPQYRNPEGFGAKSMSKRDGKQPERREATSEDRTPHQGSSAPPAARRGIVAPHMVPAANMVTASQEQRGIAHGGAANTVSFDDIAADAEPERTETRPILESDVGVSAGRQGAGPSDDSLTDEMRQQMKKLSTERTRKDGAFRASARDIDEDIAATDSGDSDWNRPEPLGADEDEAIFVSNDASRLSVQNAATETPKQNKIQKKIQIARDKKSQARKRKERKASSKNVPYDHLVDNSKEQRDRAIQTIKNNWGHSSAFWPESHYPTTLHEGNETKLQARDVSGTILGATAKLSDISVGDVERAHQCMIRAVAKREKKHKGSGSKLIVADIDEAIAMYEHKRVSLALKEASRQNEQPDTILAEVHVDTATAEQHSHAHEAPDTVMYDIPGGDVVDVIDVPASPAPQNSLPSPSVSPQMAKLDLAPPQPEAVVPTAAGRSGLLISPHNPFTEVNAYFALQWTRLEAEARRTGKLLRVSVTLE